MRDVVELQFDLTPPTQEQMQQLVADLSEDDRHLLLEHGEEAPFCGVFLHERREGLYTCRLCGLPLFKAVSKFESGTGWPSFTAPAAKDHLRRSCEAHLLKTRGKISWINRLSLRLGGIPFW